MSTKEGNNLDDSIEHLMTPGPVAVGEDVLAAMGQPVVPHYGPQWVPVYRDVQEKLKQVFRTTGDVFIIPGSGSAGLDAVVGSLLKPGDPCLVTVNGFFGERLAAIARSRGARVSEVRAEWGRPVLAEQIREALEKQGDFQAVCVVHHETSTTVLNPVKEIGALASEYGVPLIVDAISSLGGEPLDMDGWGIDFCITASQKCLEAPPGLSPVAVGTAGWQAIDRNPAPFCGWYLNLRTWREYQEKWASWHPFPVTLPTNLFLAFQVALDRLVQETVEGRIQRYASITRFLRQGLKERGFSFLVEEAWASSAATAARPPSGVAPDYLVSKLREKHHIRIAGGMGDLQGKIIRIGHMGQAASIETVERLLNALDEYLSG
jgi:alanine-glyoxylate transaminase/serine-glyoxylate transaminase/serine-pyruvate transaminase